LRDRHGHLRADGGGRAEGRAGLLLAFAVAGAICIVAALCYAEIAAMIPVAGSAYTYTYAVMGEVLAWTVGWALVLEYAVAASAVSVGWSGYFSGTILREFFGIQLPPFLAAGPLALGGAEGGFINLPAVVIALLVTSLLVRGTSEAAPRSTRSGAIKVFALAAFVILTLSSAQFDMGEVKPVPARRRVRRLGTGVGASARRPPSSSPMWASTRSHAAEETKNPKRNVPIG
jgi:APA family basic amino acid/polyamine antiporter